VSLGARQARQHRRDQLLRPGRFATGGRRPERGHGRPAVGRFDPYGPWATAPPVPSGTLSASALGSAERGAAKGAKRWLSNRSFWPELRRRCCFRGGSSPAGNAATAGNGRRNGAAAACAGLHRSRKRPPRQTEASTSKSTPCRSSMRTTVLSRG
jgi:hypothetical protein